MGFKFFVNEQAPTMLQKALHLYVKSFAGLSKSIWLLSLVTLINRSGTMVIPFLTVYLTTTRGFSLTQAGYVMGCFGMGSVLGTWLGGRLTDRWGYYPVMFWSLILGGAMFIVLQQMEQFWSICVTIFILTTLGDAFRPAMMASVASYSKPENRTRSLSLIRLAINLGFTIGPAIGGMIALSMGYDWLFWIDGLTCIGAALFFRMVLKEKEEMEEEETVIVDNRPLVKSPYQDKPFLFFFLMIFFSAFAFLPFFSAVPVYFRQDLMLNEAQIGWLLAINGVLISLLEMPMVYSMEGRFHHLKIVAIGSLLIGLAYLLFNAFTIGVIGAVLAIVAITFGEILNLPFANTFALNRSGPRNRGQYMALYGNSFSVAHVLSPVIGLQVAEHFGFATLWYLLAVMCLLSFGGLLLLEQYLAKNFGTVLKVASNKS